MTYKNICQEISNMTIKPACLILMFAIISSTAHADSFEDGKNAYNEKQYEKAATIWQTLADEGDIDSQLRLAGMYSTGLGVQRDLEKAFKLYHNAAQQGSARAQNQLGKIYAAGQGVQRDPKAAREWYLKAAEQGYAEAIYNIGVSYFKGEGTLTDYVKAHAWMHTAVVKGYAPASLYRDQLAEVMSKEKLAQSEKISSRLLKQLEDKAKLTDD